MKRPLAVGDRVKIKCVNSQRNAGEASYRWFGLYHYKGTVSEIMKDKKGCLVIRVRPDDCGTVSSADNLVPPEHCVRLKPRAKSVKVRRESLAKAWDKTVADHGVFNDASRSKSFDSLAKALGLGGEE